MLLTNWFEKTYGEGEFVISNPREEAERLMDRNRGISYLILFLSLAGLFIASVNISHILMSRTLRMKKYVGILKALGAAKNDIFKLFGTEALVVTLAGALLGSVIAFPLSNAMERAMGLDQSARVYIMMGIVLSSLLTLAFSIVPSFQNSGFEAAEAMKTAG
jgi:putative ABC transport system permease protein